MLPLAKSGGKMSGAGQVLIGRVRGVHVALAASSCLQLLGVMMGFELLIHLPVIVFTFLSLLIASGIVVVIQKPFSSNKLTKQQWFRVLINGLFLAVVWLLWAKGLQECGVFRTILLEPSHFCIAGLLGHLVRNKSAHRRKRSKRGEILFLVGIAYLLYHSGQSEQSDQGVIDELGLMWGVILLIGSSLLEAVRIRFTAKVAKSIGGARRVHALSLLCATVALSPLVFVDLVGEAVLGTDYDYSVLSMRMLGKIFVVAALVIVLNFYTVTVGSMYLEEAERVVFMHTVSTLLLFGLAAWWHLSEESPMDQDHVVVAWVLTWVGLQFIFNDTANADASLATLPYNYLEKELHQHGLFSSSWRTFSRWVLAEESLDDSLVRMPSLASTTYAKEFGGSGFANGARRLWRHIMSSSDSRKIALFLCINLAFMFVEILVGFWTNSLGLISDAGHMFFDCAALFIGLFASFVSKWKPDRNYTYGYARYETICGFVNGVFLVFIAVFIMTESLERLSEPPELSTGGLLTTSVFGFLVNLVGLVFFHDHAHMGGGGENHGHSHGSSHGHSHGNDNMHGVFLHVLADALGSLGVIISSLLIEYKGWNIADPLCSLMISVLILASVVPLLKSTAFALLLIVPDHVSNSFHSILQEVIRLPHVLGIREPQIWLHTSSHLVVSMHVVTDLEAVEQHVCRAVEDLLRTSLPNMRQLTVQVYKSNVYYSLLESRKQHTLPLFFDPMSGTLVYTTDGLLSLEQKQLQLSQPSPIFARKNDCGSHNHSQHTHQHGECHGHSHNHGHSHSQSHNHSHNQSHNHGHSHSQSHNHGQNQSHSHAGGVKIDIHSPKL